MIQTKLPRGVALLAASALLQGLASGDAGEAHRLPLARGGEHGGEVDQDLGLVAVGALGDMDAWSALGSRDFGAQPGVVAGPAGQRPRNGTENHGPLKVVP